MSSRSIRRAAALTLCAAMVALAQLPTFASAASRGAAASRPFRSWPLSPHGPALPAAGVLFGAHVGIDPVWTGSDRQSAWDAVETQVGRKLVVDREYYFFDQQFPTADDASSRDQGRTLFLSMSAYNVDGTINYWRDIASGADDATIDARAADIKAFGAPIFFTFHHEPNRFRGYDPGTPEEYRAAWRHIHDRFAADGVTNVSWVMTLMAWTFTNDKADDWYAGDQYVDLVAADGYNWFGCHNPGGPWKEVSEIFQPFYDWGVSKNKPMIIAEYGTSEDPADPNRKANWFTNALATWKTWPLLKAVVYYDQSKAVACLRWFNTSEESLAAVVAVGADPYTHPYPIVSITSGPPPTTPDTTATFEFAAEEAGVTTLCALDRQPRVACSSPWTYTGLSVGSHVFTVMGADSAGHVGNPARWNWEVTT